VSLALYVIFLSPFYNLVKFVGGIYNTGRYIPYEIEILHICCNTLFLCYPKFEPILVHIFRQGTTEHSTQYFKEHKSIAILYCEGEYHCSNVVLNRD